MRTLIAAAILAVAAGPVLAASCGERISFVRGVIDKDLKTGFIGKDVYSAMSHDLEIAGQSCRSGADAKAQLLISSTQTRHGYPVR